MRGQVDTKTIWRPADSLPAETQAYVATIAPLIGDGPVDDAINVASIARSWTEAPLFVGQEDSTPTVDQSTHPVQPNPPVERSTDCRCVGPRAAVRQPLRAGFSAESRTMSHGRSLCGVSERSDGLGSEGRVWSTRPNDGEIKAALRSPSKPLTGLVFLRAGRSGRVPLQAI